MDALLLDVLPTAAAFIVRVRHLCGCCTSTISYFGFLKISEAIEDKNILKN